MAGKLKLTAEFLKQKVVECKIFQVEIKVLRSGKGLVMGGSR